MRANICWGLIGCGDISRKRVAPALRDAGGSELVSVARARTELAAEFADEFGAPKHFADWRDLVHDPDIDAVYVTTPVHVHAPQAMAAARADKHVLCEKPIAIRAADGEAMSRACQGAGVKFGVAYYRRFYPAVRRLKELLTDGTIGDPVLVRFDAFEQFDPPPDGDRYWVIDTERSGGGPMMDFGCHRVDLLLDWFGDPVKVDSYVESVLLEREAEDTSGVRLRFASGVLGEVTVSHATYGFRDTVEIFGSKGSAHAGSLNGGDITIRTAEGERTESHPPHANIHQPLVEDFIHAINADRPPAVGADRAVAVQRVLDKIYGRA